VCKFPARELIEYAKGVANFPGRPDSIVYGAGVIKAIGELGSWHEDHTGCQCWNTACMEAGLREKPPSKIAAIPTVYSGVRFRSRLEGQYAAFFDIVGWRWEYEPIDLKGWIPDFRVTIPCRWPECGGEHVLFVEVKPWWKIDEFKGTVEYEWAMQGYGADLPCSAVALFGASPGVSYWEMTHGSGGDTYCISNWVNNWQIAWKEAGNTVQWRKPEQSPASQKKQPATARVCVMCFSRVPAPHSIYCDQCERAQRRQS
jgi:hypothetical protein